MKLIYNLVWVILIQLLIISSVFGQQNVRNNEGVVLTASDSVYAISLPKLVMPDEYYSRKARDLPSELDNSQLPFFRPTFSQQYFWNCGQAAGVGYNFTYEINASRGLSGDTSINQYSPNFTYNFMNAGEGWGVSYFNSFDAIKACGNPNLYDYGGLFNGENTRWMSGYELYEKAMRNRIDEVYSIDVSTYEGQLTLKYWLLDHLNGSEYGGVANFYFGILYSGILPSGTPDAGYPVIIAGSDIAGHALTIVGYNDSIRYDINNDGQFTNDIDINNDSIVDIKDWEIGGFRYINSSLANDGAGYIMYQTLANKFGSGGVWNEQVHCITVKEEYQPLLNLRLKLSHNSRNKIKIIAGITNDESHNYPEFTMDFPIFNYQGGSQFMQGGETLEENKMMELALDISPLLAYMNPGTPAKFFVQIAEKDKDELGEGIILDYSIVDRANGFEEIICDQTPKEILNNAITTLFVVHEPEFNKVKIITDELPPIIPGVKQTVLLEAGNGYPPFSWQLLYPYSLNQIQNEITLIEEEQLIFEDNLDGRVDVELPFLFPFYGDTVQKITVFVDGFVMFENRPYSYPYYVGEESLIKGERVISPFMSTMMLDYDDNDGVWVEKTSDYVIIRWKTSPETQWESSEANFSLVLYPDGNIRTVYGIMDFPESRLWSVGISSGDKTNYVLNNMGHKIDEISNSAFEYTPEFEIFHESISITRDGELSVLIGEGFESFPVSVMVKDINGITDKKSYSLSSTGLNFSYALGNNPIDYLDTTVISMKINNNSTDVYENVSIRFFSESSFIELLDTVLFIGTVTPQQTIDLNNASAFLINSMVPDNYSSTIICVLETDDKQWSTKLKFTVNAPNFKIINTEILDDDDQMLIPGENARCKITVQNSGHSRSMEVTSRLVSSFEHLYIIPTGINTVVALNHGDTASVEFIVAVGFNTPMGTKVNLDMELKAGNTIVKTLETELQIGHIPVLIIDPTEEETSGLQLNNMLNNFGLLTDYSRLVPGNLDDYLSVFLCLGSFFQPYQLTVPESTLLVDYLESSGKLYMEGAASWRVIDQTPLHPMFNIYPDPSGGFMPIDTIIGVSEDFTDNMIFGIDDNYSYTNYFIHPQEGAFTFFNSALSDTSGVVVAYENETYKTVGSIIQFGKLYDNDTLTTKEDYLLTILDFFGIKKYIYVGVTEIENNQTESIKLEVYPNPVKDKLNIRLFNHTSQPSYYQVFNIYGKLVKEYRLPNKLHNHTFLDEWNCKDTKGNNLPSGNYLIRYVSGNQSVSRKIVLLN